MPNHNIHLVGSIPAANAEEAMRMVSAALGDRLARIPDGETGPRADWISWLEPIFAEHPALENSGRTFRVHEQAPARTRFQIKDGVDLSNVKFTDLGYARIATESFDAFRRLKSDGTIKPDVKFQVDMVPAHSVLWLFVEDRDQGTLDPIYNRAVGGEIEKIAAAIPHDELAIQIDVASAVFARLERGDESAYGKSRDQTIASFVSILSGLSAHVPDDVDLMFHFCYGDAGHRHVVEPTDMGDMVALANALTEAIDRPIALIHMPVPRDRDDEAYFAPLTGLKLNGETELSLGLVHHTDGIEGTRRRLATAYEFVDDFSISTECGFGRRAPETIPELLRIHLAASDL